MVYSLQLRCTIGITASEGFPEDVGHYIDGVALQKRRDQREQGRD